MSQTADITLFGLIINYLLLLIPIFIFYWIRLGLIKDTIIAIVRMSIQLFLVGFYLKYLSEWNNMFVNIAWALIMIFVASVTVVRRNKLNRKLFLLPVFASILFGLIVIDIFFLGLMIDIDYKFDSRYFIPITGMLIGNLMKADVMALKEYFSKLEQEINLYRYLLANGATQFEALLPFIRSSMNVAINPLIATTSVTGLIALPGMMTGQILSGVDPLIATRYQMLVMLMILGSAGISVGAYLARSDQP